MLDTNTTPECALTLITPEYAASLLANNDRNRKLYPSLVKIYAGRMKAGRWMVNGETVIVGRSGRLLNGQNRLRGCILAGVPFQSFVATNIDDAAFDTIDSGKKRTVSDVLAIEGIKNAPAVAGAVRWIELLETRSVSLSNIAADAQTALEFVYEFPDIEHSCAVASRCSAVLQPSLGGALHYRFRLLDPKLSDTFFDDLREGAGLLKTDPVHVLRERLLRNRLAKAKMKSEEICAIVIRAWNLRRSGSPATVVKGFVRGRSSDGLETAKMPEIE